MSNETWVLLTNVRMTLLRGEILHNVTLEDSSFIAGLLAQHAESSSSTVGEYCCPECGSEHLEDEWSDECTHSNDARLNFECLDCGAKWYDDYAPVERVITEEGSKSDVD